MTVVLLHHCGTLEVTKHNLISKATSYTRKRVCYCWHSSHLHVWYSRGHYSYLLSRSRVEEGHLTEALEHHTLAAIPSWCTRMLCTVMPRQASPDLVAVVTLRAEECPTAEASAPLSFKERHGLNLFAFVIHHKFGKLVKLYYRISR
jgi:hypothetical protein